MKTLLTIFIATVTTTLVSFELVNDPPYIVYAHAAENYLLVNDSNLVDFQTMGIRHNDLELRSTNARLVKANYRYKVYVTGTHDVDLSIYAVHTGKKLYTKTFKVYSNENSVKRELTTNMPDRYSWINRIYFYLKAGSKNKFVYQTNTKINIVCEGGKVSDITESTFNVTPDKGAEKLKLIFKDGHGEMGFKEYPVK